MAVNTGKIQGKHREFNRNLNVATLIYDMIKRLEKYVPPSISIHEMAKHLCMSSCVY